MVSAAATPAIGIVGRGAYLPEDVLSNMDVATAVDPEALRRFVASSAWCRENAEAVIARPCAPCGWTDEDVREIYAEFILRRIGIATRRVVDRDAILGHHPSSRGVHASDLGAEAARSALADAEADAREVDVVVCATSSPCRLYPATAIEIQHRIGALRAHGFDVLAGCSGFGVGLELASALLRSPTIRVVLLVTAEYFTAGVNYRDPATAYFFGDAAAGFVLRRLEDAGRPPVFEVEGVRCASSYSDAITSGAGGTRTLPLLNGRVAASVDASSQHATAYFEQDGPRAYRELLPMAVGVTRLVLGTHGLTVGDVRRFLPHQASAPLLEGFRRRVMPDVPAGDRFASNLLDRGNTSSCGAALLLAEESLAEPGDALCVSVFGAGYSAAAALLRVPHGSRSLGAVGRNR